MMRILFIGDPHLKINRFDLALSFLEWIDKTIAEQKPDLVVNLGDTFDTHAVIRSEVLNEFMGHVYRTLDLGIPYVYLLGNHDMYKPSDAKYHAMLPFKGKIDNLYVVDEISELFGMTFVPYQRDGSKFPRKTSPIVVCHQTFLGADYGPIRATEGVDPSSVEGCEIIISGHVHTRSVLGPVVYVGSPFSQSAADVDQVKGVTLFDSSTFSQTFIQAPLPTWRRLHGVVSQHTSIEMIHGMVLELMRGSKDHWVFELEGPQAEVVGYLDSKIYAEAVENVDVKVKTKFTDKEKRKVSIEAKSMEHIVSEFVAKVYSGSIDRDELMKRAKLVLEESRTAK